MCGPFTNKQNRSKISRKIQWPHHRTAIKNNPLNSRTGHTSFSSIRGLCMQMICWILQQTSVNFHDHDGVELDIRETAEGKIMAETRWQCKRSQPGGFSDTKQSYHRTQQRHSRASVQRNIRQNATEIRAHPRSLLHYSQDRQSWSSPDEWIGKM